MSEVCCKRCGATDHVKNGIVRGFQRYLCLSCGCNFTMTPPRGKPPAMKALALLLYAMGNVSFGSIARILPEPSTKAEVVVVTLDEMWHFVKKTEKLWLWRAYDPIARRTIAWVLGRRDDATCQKLLNKIGLEGKTFVTDDWEGYHRLIPDDQLFTGKDPDRPHRTGQQQHPPLSRTVPPPHESRLQGRRNGRSVAEDLPPLPRQP